MKGDIMTTSASWTISGSDGEPIYGVTDLPHGEPRGVIVIAHGFKGYKDYGMFPAIASAGTKAEFIAHRFNFSHSGMTNDVTTFERPDLFERDTWNRQVTDLRAVLSAIDEGQLDDRDLPVIIVGHSRGGVTALLTVGRDPSLSVAGVMTLASPAYCQSMSDDQKAELLSAGRLASPSARTGQELHVGLPYIQEQLDDPAAHDVCALTKTISCPLCFVHGDVDEAVPLTQVRALEQAAPHAITSVIAGANHVFNTPNPSPAEPPYSPQLEELLATMTVFAQSCVRHATAQASDQASSS
ncbi:MAG: alpha/beta fold hydrolase [Planctomycetota bacterium]